METTFFPILLLFAGVSLWLYTTLSVFYPQIRGKWRGTDKTVGTMSAIGMALFCNSAMFILFMMAIGTSFLSKALINWLLPHLILLILIGFILTAVGSFRDIGLKK